MKRSPKTELFEDGLQSGTLGKTPFSRSRVDVDLFEDGWKKLRFQTKTDTCGQGLSVSEESDTAEVSESN